MAVSEDMVMQVCFKNADLTIFNLSRYFLNVIYFFVVYLNLTFN